MKEWLTQQDLCRYLQAPPATIRELVRAQRIPCHHRLGQPRFFKAEIDAWMLADDAVPAAVQDDLHLYLYRGQPIHTFQLAATKILVGPGAWNRLPGFVRKSSVIYRNAPRGYLDRMDFQPMVANFNDYLRVACQLGLIDNLRHGRQTRYYPHPALQSMEVGIADDQIKAIIKSAIFDVVRNEKENSPLPHHAIYLLWYWLKLKANGVVPGESDFNKGGEVNALPLIRFNFTRGLAQFLFGANLEKEAVFLQQWERML